MLRDGVGAVHPLVTMFAYKLSMALLFLHSLTVALTLTIKPLPSELLPAPRIVPVLDLLLPRVQPRQLVLRGWSAHRYDDVPRPGGEPSLHLIGG